MLDNDQITEDTGEDITTDPVIEEAAAAELDYTIEGEAPEETAEPELDEELGEKGRSALRAVRDAHKQERARARALEAELAALKAAPIVEDEAMPEEPTMEGCGYVEATYKAKMREFYAAEQRVEAKRQERISEAAVADADYKERFGKYTEGKQALKAPDFESAEAIVRSKLTPQQQSVLIRNCDDPAKVVLALGRSVNALDTISQVKDIDRFAFQIAKMEGRIVTAPKAPPPPESKIVGNSSSAPAISSNLQKLRTQAEKTGDYAAYFAAKRGA